MRPLLSAIILLTATPANDPASSAAPRASSGSLACNVAAAYVETLLIEAKGERIVFASDDDFFLEPLVGTEWRKEDGDRTTAAKPPSSALLKRLARKGGLNAVTRCASIRALLDRRQIGYGSKAVDAVITSNHFEHYKATIYTISLPVISADGRQAVLASSNGSAPLAGGGYLELLERQSDGKWIVLASSLLWVA